jgi:uncharacterized protein YbjT (DUF2867 family)
MRSINLTTDFVCRAICILLISHLVDHRCASFSMQVAKPKGSAAKPFEKKKIAVFGAGGYLGGNAFGFLQRAGSLYGTGIAGIVSPRAIVATSAGSVALNGILSKNFILAQADESFVKLTDMASVTSIQDRVRGFDAAIMGTRYSLEKRPVTLGSYEKTPNDKTIEFYMDRPRSLTRQSLDDPDYSFDIFKNSLEACSQAGMTHVVVVETDGQFVEQSDPGSKYLDILEACGVPYTYIRPCGEFENFRDFTYAKGIQGDLTVEAADMGAGSSLFREDVSALCVQSLMSLDWGSSRVISVKSNGSLDGPGPSRPVQQEWCVNSQGLESILSSVA